MILHTLTQAGTYRHGGKKSPGHLVKDSDLAMDHFDGAELVEHLKALWQQGYSLDVHINAHRDRRAGVARQLYPANACRECMVPR